MRPSYLYNGNPYTGKTAFLYWIGPQAGARMAKPGRLEANQWVHGRRPAFRQPRQSIFPSNNPKRSLPWVQQIDRLTEMTKTYLGVNGGVWSASGGVWPNTRRLTLKRNGQACRQTLRHFQVLRRLPMARLTKSRCCTMMAKLGVQWNVKIAITVWRIIPNTKILF